MGWSDGLALLNAVPPKVNDFSGYNSNAQRSVSKTVFAVGDNGPSPYQAAPSSWLGGFKAPAPVSKGYQPAAFPVGLNVAEPWSSRSAQPPSPYKDTSGDLLGSFGESWNNAIGGTGGYLNLGNSISYLQERTVVAAKTLADAISGQPSDKNNPGDVFGNVGSMVGKALSGNFAGAFGDAINAFAGTYKAAAEPVMAAAKFVPDMAINSALNGRMESYKALVTGRTPDISGVRPGLVFSAGGKVASTWGLVNLLAGSSATPQTREQARTIVAGAIDLPSSVKDAIQANPNGDLAAYLDKAPEGRRITYEPGFGGEVANLVGTGALYAIEMMAVGAAASAAQGPALGTLGTGGRLTTLGQTLAGPAALVGKGVTVMMKANKLMLASGLSYFGANLVVESVLRTMGDKAGVERLDRINRTPLISDSPAVQFVSSFTVDPIGAAKAAGRGMLHVVGAPGIVFDATAGRLATSGKPALSAIGQRMTKMYTSETAVLDRLAAMYGTDRAAASAMIGPGLAYETKGDAFDQVLGLAANTVADHLPAAEKLAINALDDTQRTAVLMGPRYIGRVFAEFDKTSGLVSQFRSDWSYRNFYGIFDPNIAQIVTRSFRGAMKKTVEARERNNSVVGTIDFLNPEGQAIVSSKIDGFFADGRQGTLRDLNTLSAEHPALDGLVKDLVAQGVNGRPFVKPTDLVPREVFDAALQRGTEAYDAAKAAPGGSVRIATGADPVLRPGVHLSDWAAAVNTTEDTVKAITSAARTPAGDDLIRTFVRDKGIVPPAEILSVTPEALQARAVDWLDRTTAPWVARGAQVDLLEAEMGKAAERLVELRRARAGTDKFGNPVAEPKSVPNQEIAAAEAEVAAWQNLKADATEPTTTTGAAGAVSALRAEGKVMQAARRRIDAIGRVAAIQTIRDTLAPADRLVATVGADLLHSVQRVEGEWQWIADTRIAGGPVFEAAKEAYARFRNFEHPNARYLKRDFEMASPSQQASEMADSPGFVDRLNANPDKIVSGTDGITNGDVAAMVKSGQVGHPVESEITPGMIDALGIAPGPDARATFINRVGELRDAYDAALHGRTEIALGRTAASEVPSWAADHVAKGLPAFLWSDPIREGDYANAINDLKAALDGTYTFRAVRGIIEGNPTLQTLAADALARQGATATAGGVRGWSLRDFLTNPANKDAIRTLIPDVLPIRDIPGVPHVETARGQAILAGDETALPDLKAALEAQRAKLPEPLKDVPVHAVDAIASAPRLSVKLADDLNVQGIAWNTRIPEVLWAKSDVGAKMLSVLHSLTFHEPPQTIHGLLSVLRDIENGNAAKIGIDVQLAAEAQRLGAGIVKSMIGDARRASLELGVIQMGSMDNPYTWSADTERAIQNLYAQSKGAGMVTFKDPLGLQYGLKQRPRGRTDTKTGEFVPANPAIDMNRMPAGFAEEILSGHFQPWNERLISVGTKQAFSRLFHIDNQQITFEARARFETQLAQYGLPAKVAERIWTAWRNAAKETHVMKWVRDKTTGERVPVPGDSALYATEKNIPNNELQTVARKALDDYFSNSGGTTPEMRSIDFAREMRIAGSFTRRNLAGLVDKGVPLANFLEKTYGVIAHNYFVTTGYFIFRFSLDSRFHAMNRFEGPFLYGGAAGLKTAELDQGMFGLNRGSLARDTASETMLDTGYPFSATRVDWMYKYIKKMQPDALRGIVKADPKLVKQAVEGAALHDPQIADMIAMAGHTPNEYLTILDRHWTNIMKSADPEAMIDGVLLKDLVQNPELEQVYARISQVNKELIDSARQVFYGNPARGQVERFLNSYLVYWPISYQIKATKWLLHIMYGKIGGIQTGGLGAYAMDQLQAEHEKRLVTDPEYQKWFADHPTLVFAAQMMLPIAPGGIGVGVSPLIADLFFGGAKGVAAVGPVYTVTKFLPQLYGDLYPDVKSLLGEGIAALPSRMLGQKPPGQKTAPPMPFGAPWTPATPP